MRRWTPSAPGRIRLLRSCLNHDGLRPPPEYTDRGYPVQDVVMSTRDPVTMGQSPIRSAGLHAPTDPVQDVGVNHRGADIMVTQRRLDSTDVVAGPQGGPPFRSRIDYSARPVERTSVPVCIRRATGSVRLAQGRIEQRRHSAAGPRRVTSSSDFTARRLPRRNPGRARPRAARECAPVSPGSR